LVETRMLLHKPTHAGGSPTVSSRFFTEIDEPFSSVPSPPPVPVSPSSKTHAFFSSPFSSGPPSPPLPPKKLKTEESGRPTPPRSLTADFFSTNPLPIPPKPSPARRNFLNLDLEDDIKHYSPLTLAGAFASTPTPTGTRDEYISKPESSEEASSEPTPKPPSLVYHQAQDQHGYVSPAFDTLPSASSINSLGTEPDAEVLSTSPSFSYMSSLSLTVSQPLSTYPSRPASSNSFHSIAPSQQDLNSKQSFGGDESLYPAGDEEELASGMIIRSFLPSSRTTHLPLSTSTPSTYSISNNTSSASSVSVPVTLRLVNALGQGTFSSVWLAEDLSPTSLLLRSRKSLKDIKRKSTVDLKAKEASLSSKDGKLKSSLTTTSSLMRRLRGGVSGTRPGGTSASSIQGSDNVNGSTENYLSAGIAMGRRGTLMPPPMPPPMPSSFPPPAASASNGHDLASGLPPSLIPGNRSSSSPSVVSSRTLGLAFPAMHPQLASSTTSASDGQSVDLEFGDFSDDNQSPPFSTMTMSMSPPMTPNLYSPSQNQNQGASVSVSRASSVSLKSSASSDEGGEDGVHRTQSTRSTRSSHSGLGVMEQDQSVSRQSSTKSKSSMRRNRSKTTNRLVAVKLTSRGVIEEREREREKSVQNGKTLTRREKVEEEERARERDRTRVSFVREVEVLKHISHPNITPLLSHLTTRTHHLLVLPYLSGGDLLGLVNDESCWNNLGESELSLFSCACSFSFCFFSL
jgi:hypothetical protein